MTARPVPGELPYQVHTPNGPAVITLVTIALDVPLVGARDRTIRCDRLILRSVVDAQPDVYAVFERVHGRFERWQKVTGDLTPDELNMWPAHRRATRGWSGAHFERWLDHVALRMRT
jgi:hypothetical protein